MALVTYADLLAAVASWIARSDLTSTIPDFVTLFESHANRVLRVRRMETSTTLTPDVNAEATLPTDFLEYRRLTWMGSTRRNLDYVSPDYFQYYNPTRLSGTPQIFTIEGATIKVNMLSTTNVQLDYIQKIAALSGTANWLMAQHPDAYLFGTMVEANVYMKNPEAAQLWAQRRDDALTNIIGLDMAAKGPSAMKVMDSPTP